jgi:putative transposase
VVSRRPPGRVPRHQAIRQLSKAHFRLSNLCKDALHPATTWLARTQSAMALEDLKVNGMLKNHPLAQAIAHGGVVEFCRRLQYKGAWYGCDVFLADRFFPATKRCSQGGHERAIGLAQRGYRCAVCRLVMDRDLNAAIHLEQWLYL